MPQAVPSGPFRAEKCILQILCAHSAGKSVACIIAVNYKHKINGKLIKSYFCNKNVFLSIRRIIIIKKRYRVRMGQDNLDKNNISKIELSLDNVKAVSKGMPGGFFIYKADEGEELIAWNDMVLTIFGCADDVEFKALAGNSFRGMVHRDDYALVDKSIIEQVASDTHKFDHVEYRIIKKNGEEAWVDDFGRLVDTTEFGLVYFVFIRDVTEQKRIQAENLRIHLELEKEKQIKNAIDEFLFNVSHDIRTPMNAITGYTELALHSIDDRAELTGCLEKIKISGGHMMSLIDDLLEMSELSSGNIELHTGPCSISKEMKTATEMLKERADEKNIMLSQLHYYL